MKKGACQSAQAAMDTQTRDERKVTTVSELTQPISDMQLLQFNIMRHSSFNEFDGDRVVDSLIANRRLWRGVVMDRAGHTGMNPRPIESVICLIKLRDIEDDVWNVDTVFILPSGVDDNALFQLAESDEWAADEVDWIVGREAQSMLGSYGADVPSRILRVWWD